MNLTHIVKVLTVQGDAQFEPEIMHDQHMIRRRAYELKEAEPDKFYDDHLVTARIEWLEGKINHPGLADTWNLKC